jgi:hypothetical protein
VMAVEVATAMTVLVPVVMADVMAGEVSSAMTELVAAVVLQLLLRRLYWWQL